MSIFQISRMMKKPPTNQKNPNWPIGKRKNRIEKEEKKIPVLFVKVSHDNRLLFLKVLLVL